MKRKSNRIQITMLFIVLFLIGACMPAGRQIEPFRSKESSDSRSNSIPSISVAYIDHAPVHVEDDEDFETGDWDGEGTEESPFILSGYKFNTTGTGVRIEETTSFFKIRNCLFVGEPITIGISLLSVENAIIEDSIFIGISKGLSADRTETTLINSSLFSDCDTGIDFLKANNSQIILSTFNNSGTAIRYSKSDFLDVQLCSFEENGNSLYLSKVIKTAIADCVFKDGNIGILTEYIVFLNISKSEFSDLQYAIFSTTSQKLYVSSSEFIECLYGIYISSNQLVDLTRNQLYNIDYGIYLTSVNLFNITENRVEFSAYDGVNIRYCDGGSVVNNIVQYNERYGIRLFSSNNIQVYGNEIGWNEESNTIDSIGTLPFVPTNLWDDNSSHGNGYSDYNGEKTYVIPGTVASTDRYPSYILYVSSPDDIIVEYGTDASLVWNTSALNPDCYKITRDDEILIQDYWTSGILEIDIAKDLAPGIYHYTVWLNTTTNRIIEDAIQVTIQDTNNPEWIEIPQDQTIEAGTDFSYLLQAEDVSGISYYWVNDTTNFCITGSQLEDNDILSIGIYSIEVRAYDPYDNFCTANLIISVTDSTNPEISNPENLEYEYGTTGNSIVWTFSDVCPDSYELYLDNELIMSGLWNETTDSLNISIDGLSVGLHIFKLVIFDQSGNSISDEVTITVVEEATTMTSSTTSTSEVPTGTLDSTTSSTDDTSSIFVPTAIIGIGVGAVIVVVVILSKKGIFSKD